jgi:hypothetical protein
MWSQERNFFMKEAAVNLKLEGYMGVIKEKYSRQREQHWKINLNR